MTKSTRRTIQASLILALSACSDDGVSIDDSGTDSTATETGDGDPGDGDPGDGDPGDGDGDPGDGDGDPNECGDGVVGDGEECDDGNADNSDDCLDTCVAASCGDGFVWTDNEDCDDANADDTDDCLSGCVAASCGDGFVWADNEDCDDANADDTDDCLSDCVAASCGDGFLWADNEECDDGNLDDTDDCVAGCVPAGCGDGFVWAGMEDCDDANMDDGDACSSDCVAASCGDGILWDGVETCDDANMAPDDGCSDVCGVELYYRCVDVGPNSCAPVRILYAIGYGDDANYRAEIAALTGGPVDYFDARMGTPMLMDVEADYDCVMTHSGDPYADRGSLSDLLVGYVDGGGTVVLGPGCGFVDALGFGGLEIMSDMYSPVSTDGAVSFMPANYAADGTSLLHTNVNAYGLDIYETGLTAQGMGEVDGTYDTGEVTTAYQPDYKVVFLNGAGHSLFSPSGDWATLAANACSVGYTL